MVVDGIQLGDIHKALINFEEAVDKLGLSFKIGNTGSEACSVEQTEDGYEITIHPDVPVEKRKYVIANAVSVFALGIESDDIDYLEPTQLHIGFEGHREYYEKNDHLPGAAMEKLLHTLQDLSEPHE